MKYQAGPNFQWWFKTYVLRQKGLTKPQLYKLGNQRPPVSVTHQMSYAWNTYVLRKKGLAKPDPYVKAAPQNTEQVQV